MLSPVSGTDFEVPMVQGKNSERGKIGAFQARVNSALDMYTVLSENCASAASRIMDVDVASEAASMLRSQILERLGSAILAQANQEPALALTLSKTM